MNAIVLRLTVALAALLATASVTAAEVEKKPEERQAEIERQLEDARSRLDTAAREVAELSMSMSEYSVPSMAHFVTAGRQRAMLGINLGTRGEGLAEGVEVVSVSPGGAAESAGLKGGDVLLAIDNKPLKRDGDTSARDQLMKAMREVKPGDTVQLRYRRDKKVATVIIAAQGPTDRMFAMPMPMRGQIATGAAVPMPPLAFMRAVGVFGSAELVPLTPKLGQYFGTDKGLLVVRAPADNRLKLEDGDVIVDIDGRTPSSPTHAFRILGSYQPGEQLKLNVLRQKKKMAVEVTVPEEPSAAQGRVNPFQFQQHDRLMRGPGMDHTIGLPPPPPPPPGEAGQRIIRIEDEPA